MPERLLVIGGDAAGMSAASQARRLQPFMEIVALEKGDHTSYSACGIPYLVSGEVTSAEALVARSPETFRDRHRIDARTRHEAMAIDLDARRVEVRDHARERTFQLPFDLLHIATGARPIRPDLPGIDAPFVHGVQTLGDGLHLLAHTGRIECRRVVVVGGGYIGMEMAEAFAQRGSQVTVVEAGAQVMSTFDPDLAATIVSTLRRSGVDVRLGASVTGFEAGRVLTTQGDLEADVVVLALGVAPNSALAEEAGITVGVRRAIRVDRQQRTSAEGVFAAGDCAESFHRVTGRQVYVALGTVANRQGRVAGTNLAGGYATFPGVLGTAVSRIFDLEVGRTGVNEGEADRAGLGYVVGSVTSTTRAGYFPGAAPLTMKVLAERGSGRLVGAQIVGGAGSAKRIDVAATAIAAGLTVEEVVGLDLAYAPPFGGVWDPLQIAARRAAEAL